MALLPFNIPVPGSSIGAVGAPVDISTATSPVKTFLFNGSSDDILVVQASKDGLEPWGNLAAITGDDDSITISFIAQFVRLQRRKGATGTLSLIGSDAISPIAGTVTADQGLPGALPWLVTDPPVEAALDVLLSTRASEASLLTRASEASLLTRASEATLSIIGGFLTAFLDAPMSSRASEATLLTRATEATLALIKAKTDNLDVLLSTRASEASLITRATEATLALIKAKTDNLDVLLSTRATEATLLTRLAEATFTARINTLGQKLMATSTPVVLPSDQSAIPVNIGGGAVTTSTLTNIAESIVSGDLVAANPNRKGLIIANDSASILYVQLGAGPASATSYSYRLTTQVILELQQPIYQGTVTGIWAAPGAGAARITELA